MKVSLCSIILSCSILYLTQLLGKLDSTLTEKSLKLAQSRKRVPELYTYKDGQILRGHKKSGKTMNFIHDLGHKTGLKSLVKSEGVLKINEVIPKEAWSILEKAHKVLGLDVEDQFLLRRHYRFMPQGSNIIELANTVSCYTKDVNTDLTWRRWMSIHNEGVVKSFDLAREILDGESPFGEPSKDFWIISILATLCNHVAPHSDVLQARLASKPLNDKDLLFVRGAAGKSDHLPLLFTLQQPHSQTSDIVSLHLSSTSL